MPGAVGDGEMGVTTGSPPVSEQAVPTPVLRRVLGRKFDVLPRQVRAVHECDGQVVARGHAVIERGGGWLGRIIGWCLHLPGASENAPVCVTISQRNGREVVQQDLAGWRMTTLREAGRGRFAGHLIERAGFCTLALAVPSGPRGLRLEVRGLSLFGIRCPPPLWPKMMCSESERDGVLVFDVSLDLPVIGRLIRYRCYLDVCNGVQDAP